MSSQHFRNQSDGYHGKRKRNKKPRPTHEQNLAEINRLAAEGGYRGLSGASG